MNFFFIEIEIQWKTYFTVITSTVTKSQCNYVHDMIAQLLSHVQNFVSIALLGSKWD